MVKEFSLRAFAFLRPDIVSMFADMGVDISDPDYIVRVSDDGTVEIGYSSDSWMLSPVEPSPS